MVSRIQSSQISEPSSSRQRILDSSRELFSMFGYDGTSVDQIALSAGVKKPLVFHYFPSKQAILLELMGSLWEGVLRNRQTLTGNDSFGGDPVEQMKVDFRYLVEHRDLVRISTMEELKDVAKGGDSVFMNRWRQNLETGREEFAQAGIDFGVSPDTLVAMLVSESLFKWYLSVEDAFVAVAGIDRAVSRAAFLRQAEIVLKAFGETTLRSPAAENPTKPLRRPSAPRRTKGNAP